MSDLLPRLRVQGTFSRCRKFSCLLRFSKRVSTEAREDVQQVVTQFQLASNRGAFGVGSNAAGMLGFDADATSRPSATTMLWQCHRGPSTLSALQVLRSTVGGLRHIGILCREIQIVAGGATASLHNATVPWPDEDTEWSAYPTLNTVAKDLLVSDSDNQSWSRRMLIDMTPTIISPAWLPSLREWIAPWVDLLEGGAYAMPIDHPAEVASIYGGLSQFDRHTLEIAIDRFQASECAWYSLANLVCAHPIMGPQIKQIVID